MTKALLAIIADDGDERLPVDARASLIVLAAQLQVLQTLVGSFEKRIIAQHRASEASKRLASIPGIGRPGRERHHRHGHQRIPVGTRFCGRGRTCAATRFNWRQTEASSEFFSPRAE